MIAAAPRLLTQTEEDYIEEHRRAVRILASDYVEAGLPITIGIVLCRRNPLTWGEVTQCAAMAVMIATDAPPGTTDHVLWTQAMRILTAGGDAFAAIVLSPVLSVGDGQGPPPPPIAALLERIPGTNGFRPRPGVSMDQLRAVFADIGSLSFSVAVERLEATEFGREHQFSGPRVSIIRDIRSFKVDEGRGQWTTADWQISPEKMRVPTSGQTSVLWSGRLMMYGHTREFLLSQAQLAVRLLNLHRREPAPPTTPPATPTPRN